MSKKKAKNNSIEQNQKDHETESAFQQDKTKKTRSKK
ncbi:biofilm-forming protein [Robertmurraya kyonggiensis]|uniref:Biofilm-forming protein n=1 Tax=Robertmurraya kyonggiensis TaxID=1037680 RepID=A0A4U1DAG4_9BACI|nr:biofilm-forming protein [Robertmurraya kyonggiensis]TKC18456.1 biofilm-forming protein [Robertmurraya kyonggiensis]